MKNTDFRLVWGVGQAEKLVRDGYVGKIIQVSKRVDFDMLRQVLFNDSYVLNETQTKRAKRKVPENVVCQEFDYDCGWGTFSTLMIMKGREDVLKTDLYKRLDVNPIEGTTSEKIKEVLDEENIPYLEIWSGDFLDVEKAIESERVVLVSYQAWGEPDEIERLECGHYSIIFDIDEEFVWLIDPSWEPNWDEGVVDKLGKGVVKRTRSEFERLWVDKGSDGIIYQNWMMVV